MRVRHSAAILAASLLSLLTPTPGAGQALATGDAAWDAAGFALDLRLGVTSGSTELGASTGVPDGVFNLRDLGAAPIFGVGALFPETVLGLRPQALVTYATAADVEGNWVPCDPGFACPEILLPVDGSASRLQATAGVELPILTRAGPARPYASVGIGLRRYGISWASIGDPGDSFRLAAGSYGETDLLVRFGLGVGVSLGGFEALLEGSADLSRFGAGRVPVPEELLAQWAGSTIDLGRDTREHFEVVLGMRRYVE